MASFSRRGFTGHRHNDALGLIYMNARYYLPGISRFVSADTLVPEPADPQSLNRYSYALNNPVKYRDPSGHYATYDNASTCGTVGSGCVEGKNFVEVAYHVYSEYDVYFSEPSSAWNSSEWWVQLATMPDEQQRDVHDMLLNPVQTPNTLGYNTSQPLVSTEHAARVIGTVDTILDVGAVWDDFYPHIPLVRGIPGTWVLPGVGQFLNDWSQSYHPVERVVRATIVAGEGLVIDQAAVVVAGVAFDAGFKVGAGAAVATGQVYVAPATGFVFAGSAFWGTQTFGEGAAHYLNQKVAFPAVHSVFE